MMIEPGRQESVWVPVSRYLLAESVSQVGADGSHRWSEWVEKRFTNLAWTGREDWISSK
jgi:hypothetical protein